MDVFDFRTGFDYSSTPSSLNSSMESLTKRGAKRGLRNSIGKIFSTKTKLRTKDSSSAVERAEMNSDTDGHRDTERRIKQKLLEDVIHSRTPFSSWNAPTILAWLEVGRCLVNLWLGLPLQISLHLNSRRLLYMVLEECRKILFN